MCGRGACLCEYAYRKNMKSQQEIMACVEGKKSKEGVMVMKSNIV